MWETTVRTALVTAAARVIIGWQPGPVSRRLAPSQPRLDRGYNSPSVTSSTLICSSAVARTSWTGDRMALRVSMRTSLSSCWTGPAAEPDRAFPAVLMLCVCSQLAIQTARPAQLRMERAENQRHGGVSAPMHGNLEAGLCGRKCVLSSGWAHVFLNL